MGKVKQQKGRPAWLGSPESIVQSLLRQNTALQVELRRVMNMSFQRWVREFVIEQPASARAPREKVTRLPKAPAQRAPRKAYKQRYEEALRDWLNENVEASSAGTAGVMAIWQKWKRWHFTNGSHAGQFRHFTSTLGDLQPELFPAATRNKQTFSGIQIKKMPRLDRKARAA